MRKRRGREGERERGRKRGRERGRKGDRKGESTIHRVCDEDEEQDGDGPCKVVVKLTQKFTSFLHLL